MKPAAVLMKLLTDRMPRKAAIASITMGVTLVTFGLLFLFLGGAHSDALEKNQSLKKNLTQTSTTAKQAKDDRQFVLDNKEKYEELLRGDRLVPHTPTVAQDHLSMLVRKRGLTSASIAISAVGEGAAAKVASQPVSGGYKVQVQKLELKVGAPLDTQIFEFLLDLGESFPGSAVVEQFKLERATDITTDALNQVSRGTEAGLVKGEVTVIWRTAQAEDKDKKDAVAARGGK